MTSVDDKGRVLVLGGRGMLGRAVAEASRAAGYQTWCQGSEVDIANEHAMRTVREAINPRYVVNCAGIIPARLLARRESDMVRTNALGPWVISDVYHDAYVIHISTDCVFGARQPSPAMRTIHDAPAPDDLYGRTKLAGEAYGVHVVRTSFIGPQGGLLAWLLAQPAGSTIPGWVNAWWSGGTVYDVADWIVARFSIDDPDDSGFITHLAGDPINKHALLSLLIDILELPLKVEPLLEPRIFRALRPTSYLDRNLERLAEKVAVHAG